MAAIKEYKMSEAELKEFVWFRYLAESRSLKEGARETYAKKNRKLVEAGYLTSQGGITQKGKKV